MMRAVVNDQNKLGKHWCQRHVPRSEKKKESSVRGVTFVWKKGGKQSDQQFQGVWLRSGVQHHVMHGW